MASDDRNEAGATVLALDQRRGGVGGAPVVGWLVSHDPDHGPRVDWPGNGAGPTSARSVVALPATVASAAIEARRGVVLLFERDDPARPIIVGLLEEGPTVEAELPEASPDVRVDGKRVRLEGADEIVLRCGKASIVLRRNGRVIIRGTWVESRSSGTHRIKGGSVLIN